MTGATPAQPIGDRPLRVVVSGAGFVTPFHLAGWARLPGVAVAAIAGRNREACAQRAAAHGITRVYQDLAEALDRERPDILDICTPAEVHLAQARLACERGIHFICQKPLAQDLATAEEIAAVAEAAAVRAMVHENFRFRPWYRALGSLIRRGDIGAPFYLRSAQRMAGTVTTSAHPEAPWSLARQPFFARLQRFLILESMIHQVDVARWLLGEPRSVYARARRVSPLVQGEDMAILHLTFEDAEAVLERSYASRGRERPPVASEEVVVEGERGAAFVDADGALRVICDTPAGHEERAVPVDGEDAYARSYAAAIEHFVTALRKGEPFETSLEDNLKTLAATLAAYRSIESGGVVMLSEFKEHR